MTNGTTNHREEVFKALDLTHRGTLIAKALKGAGETAEKAEEEKRRYGLDGLLKDNAPNSDNPEYTEAQFNSLTEREQRDRIEISFAGRQSRALDESVIRTSKNIDEVLKESGKYHSNLADVADDENIIATAPSDRQEVMADFTQYLAFKKLAKDIDEGKSIPAQAKRLIEESISANAQHTQYNELKGYSEQTRKIFAQLAGLSSVDKATREDMKKGAELRRDEEESKMSKKYGNDYKEKVAEGVGKAVEGLLKSGDPEKQQIAMSTLYRSERGYGLGGQDPKNIL